MNENEEKKILGNTRTWLLRLLTACPQVVKKGIGAKSFAEELINSGLELEKHSSDFFGAVDSFLPFITIRPQIFEPEIGIKAFIDELNKAAVTFNKSVKQPDLFR